MENEQEIIRQAMSIMGRSKSPAKIEALNENRKRLSDPDVRQRRSESQKARRERERAEKGIPVEASAAEKRPVGRPRKVVEETAEERPRGRPKKV